MSKVRFKKQGLIQHKPWPIQTVKDFQDSCRLSSQLQTVKSVVNSHKRSCIRETKNLLTDVDSRINTILKRLCDISHKKNLEVA